MGLSEFVLSKVDNTMAIGDHLEMMDDATRKLYVVDTKPALIAGDWVGIDATALVVWNWSELDPRHGGAVGLWVVSSTDAGFIALAEADGDVHEAEELRFVGPGDESVAGTISVSAALASGSSWSPVPDSTQLNADGAMWPHKAMELDEVDGLATGSGQRVALIDVGLGNMLRYRGAVAESKGTYPPLGFPQLDDPVALATGTAYVTPADLDSINVSIDPDGSTPGGWTEEVVFDGSETTVALAAAKMNTAFAAHGTPGGEGSSDGAYAFAIELDPLLAFAFGVTHSQWVCIGSNYGNPSTTVTVSAGTGSAVTDLGFEDGQVGEWEDQVGNYNVTFAPMLRLKYMKVDFNHPAFGGGAFDVAASTGSRQPAPFPTAINAAGAIGATAPFRARGRAFGTKQFELIDSGDATSGGIPRSLALNVIFPGIEKEETIIWITGIPQALPPHPDVGFYKVKDIIYTNGGKTNIPESLVLQKLTGFFGGEDPGWNGWTNIVGGADADPPHQDVSFRWGDFQLFTNNLANSRTYQMSIMDAYGHGTQMASIINGLDGLGIAPDAQIVSLHHGFSLAGFLAAVEAAIVKNVDVVVTTFPFLQSFTGSPGFEGTGRIVRKAFQQLHKAGIPVYSVAGNQAALHPQGKDKPLSLSGTAVFGVSALGPLAYDPNIPNNPSPDANLDLFANAYSSYGVYVDVAGPAGNYKDSPATPILGQWFNFTTTASQRRVGGLTKSEADAKGHTSYPISVFYGTSAASAAYAGVTALATEVLSNESDKQNKAQVIGGLLRGKATEDGLSSDDAPGHDQKYGHGRVNARILLNALAGIKE